MWRNLPAGDHAQEPAVPRDNGGMPRRSVVGVALLGLLVASVMLPAPAAASVTRTATVGTAPLRPGIRFDFVSVSWRGPSATGAIRFRRLDRWTRWQVLRPGDTGRAGRITSALVRAPG